MKKLMLIALSTLAMGAQAADDKKFYAGGAASALKMKLDGAGSGQFNIAAIEGTFGYEVFPWLAVEGRLGAGVERDLTTVYSGCCEEVVDETADTTTYYEDASATRAELEYYASIYLKPQLKNDVAVFYGLLGATTYSALFNYTTTTHAATYQPDSDGDLVSRSSVVGQEQQAEESETSFSMGVGVGFYFKDNYVFNIEYRNLIHSMPVGDTEADIKTSALTFAVNYSF